MSLLNLLYRFITYIFFFLFQMWKLSQHNYLWTYYIVPVLTGWCRLPVFSGSEKIWTGNPSYNRVLLTWADTGTTPKQGFYSAYYRLYGTNADCHCLLETRSGDPYYNRVLLTCSATSTVTNKVLFNLKLSCRTFKRLRCFYICTVLFSNKKKI